MTVAKTMATKHGSAAPSAARPENASTATTIASSTAHATIRRSSVVGTRWRTFTVRSSNTGYATMPTKKMQPAARPADPVQSAQMPPASSQMPTPAKTIVKSSSTPPIAPPDTTPGRNAMHHHARYTTQHATRAIWPKTMSRSGNGKEESIIRKTPSRLLVDFTNHAARIASRCDICRNIARHHGTCTDNSAIPDAHARQYDDAAAQPAAIADRNWPGIRPQKYSPVSGFQSGVSRSESSTGCVDV